MTPRPVVASVHAVDGRGEEGVLADAAVCADLLCRHAAVVTSILAAGRKGPDALEPVSLGLLGQQCDSLLPALRPVAGRTGILCDPRQVELVAELLRRYAVPDLVVAPVFRVGRTRVLDDETLDATRRYLYPLARVVAIRVGDLAPAGGRPVRSLEEMKEAAERIRGHGARAVLVAGALHRGRVVDLLDDEGRVRLFDTTRVNAPRVEGLAGAHATALAAHLARGRPLARAVEEAQRYMAFKLRDAS